MRIATKLIVGAGVSLLALATPAYAQAPADEGAAAANSEIIVSARRRDESIQDVPAVVQAVSGSELERLELRKFEDLAAVVPGLTLETSLGGISSKAALRGVDFDGRAAGSFTSVETYRNDAVIPGAGIFQAIFDVDQIEVLRGPQGTLKGRASPSGSITVRTRKPDMDEFGGVISGTVAERHRWNINGAVNLPIIADKLAVRVAGFTGKNRGNLVRGLNLVTRAVDDDIFDKTEAVRASVRADPFDGVLLLDFNYEHVSRKGRSYNQVESYNLVVPSGGASPVTIRSDDYLGVGGLADSSEQSLDIFNWQAQLNLFGQSLIYLGQDFKINTLSIAPQDTAGVVTNPVFNGLAFANDTRSGQTNTVHEVRLQNQDRLFGMFDYVLGFLSVKAGSPTTLPTFVSRVAPSAAGTPFVDLNLLQALPIIRYRDAKEESFYGNLTAHLGDRTEISGGLRRISLKQNSGLIVAGSPIAAATDCRGVPSVAGCLPTTKATIYSASIKHKFTDDIMAYFSYGSSYRPGNVVIATAFQGIGPFLGQFVRPPDEKSESFEIGVKTSWLDDTLRFNLTGFHQKFENFVVRPGSPVLALANVYTPASTKAITSFDGLVVAADAKIKGIEAELSWVPSKNFNLSAVLAYTHGKVDNTRFPCVDINDDNVPDTVAPTAEQLYAEVGTDQVDTCSGSTSPAAAPNWSGSVVAEYNREVAHGIDAFVRGLVNFKGFNEGVGFNPLDSVKSHALFDLFLGVRDPEGAWNVTLYGKNIFNTHRVLTRSDAPLASTFRLSGAFSGTNYLRVTSTQPREFGVTARFALGSR